MAAEGRQLRGLLRATALAVGALAPAIVGAQALAVERLANRTTLVYVARPLSDATSVAWPEVGPGGELKIRSVVAGRLTLVADLEAALGQGALPPVVVVAAGNTPVQEVRDTLTRLLVAPPQLLAEAGPGEPLVEGGLERRLGPPGSEAMLGLAVALPPPGDWRRSSVEVLLELLPDLLARDFPGLLLRVEGDRALLETRVDPELADLRLRALRLGLARIATEPGLGAQRVEGARRRLDVRRLSQLDLQPEGAGAVLDLWLEGGEGAVRELLFGLEGVTLESVQRAASEWLPQHPGAAVLLLPPQVLSPHFAAGPQVVKLDNDLAVAILERPESPLATLCLRPVLVPDVDGEVAATILARLAAELRGIEGAPAWIRVERSPVRLELAAEPDGFAELCEALRLALQRLAADEATVVPTGDDARSRALQLVAARVGLAEAGELTPAQLLRPDNLALGVVVTDGEAAAEAVRKFFADLRGAQDRPRAVALAPGQRTREAARGQGSVLALVVPAGAVEDPVPAWVLAELLRVRASATSEVEVEVLEPLVPGRHLLVVLIRAEMRLDQLERWTRAAWPRWTAAVAEGDLAALRRRVAATVVAGASGPGGYARLCAAVAAGEREWRTPAQLELEILSLEAAKVEELLRGARGWKSLETAGAGLLPLTGPDRQPQPEGHE